MVSTSALVLEKCLQRAIAMSGGDTKTLKAQGFAIQSRGKELLPERVYLPSDWTDAACPVVLRSRSKTAEKQYVKVRKARGDENGCRGLLWRLQDLDEVEFELTRRSCINR